MSIKKIITYGVMLLTWMSILEMVKGKNQIPLSGSELAFKRGEECIDNNQGKLAEFTLLSCFLEVSNAISTHTLKAKFLDVYATRFYEIKQHNIDMSKVAALVEEHRQLAIKDSEQEVALLRNEITVLEEAKEYNRIFSLFKIYQDTPLSSINNFITEKVTAYEEQAENVLAISKRDVDIVQAYIILNYVYSLQNDFLCKVAITNRAIHAINSYRATKKFKPQLNYFNEQNEQAKNIIENEGTNKNSRCKSVYITKSLENNNTRLQTEVRP